MCFYVSYIQHFSLFSVGNRQTSIVYDIGFYCKIIHHQSCVFRPPNKDAVSLFIGEYKKVAEIIEKNTAFSINMNMCCKNRCIIDHFRTKLNVLEKKTNSIRNVYKKTNSNRKLPIFYKLQQKRPVLKL